MNTTTEHVRELRARRRELSSQLEALDNYLESLAPSNGSAPAKKTRRRSLRDRDEILEQVRAMFRALGPHASLSQWEAVKKIGDDRDAGTVSRVFNALEAAHEIKRDPVKSRPAGASKALTTYSPRELRVSAGNGAEQGRLRNG